MSSKKREFGFRPVPPARDPDHSSAFLSLSNGGSRRKRSNDHNPIFLNYEEQPQSVAEANSDWIDVDDLLDLYLQDVAKYRLLEPAEELSLAIQLELGKLAEILLQEVYGQPPPDVKPANSDQNFSGPSSGFPDIGVTTWQTEIATQKATEQKMQTAEVEQKLRAWIAENTDLSDVALMKLVEQGNAAKNVLIESNLRLVVSVAKKYRGKGVEFEDLIQAGNYGLIYGINKFQFWLGNRVSTYVTYWIRQNIERSVANTSRTIRIPVNLNSQLSKLPNETRRQSRILGRKPTTSELAIALGMSEEQLVKLTTIDDDLLSLDTPPTSKPGGGGDFWDIIEDPNSPNPAELAEWNDLAERLIKALDELSPGRAQIITLKFGLEDGPPLTRKQIGDVCGRSQEWIRLVELGILRKLRRALDVE
ncbi:MAG: hypothetical protein COU69_00440 [Candidatus Pacebacteria bacterium CG10_big_fil_rev_8_21_14_0_10_56_10]|nr:MAG: hypothetical protein COU69_00440 [Candidatus Pacebacteria bacterium CG10_big_fil_rev_8_21_14_0_10_56_10]